MKSDSGRYMLFVPALSANLLIAGAALLGLMCVPLPICAEPPAPHPQHTAPVEAQFRGCEAVGWCRFWIESAHPTAESLYRVRPDGVPRTSGDEADSIVVRNRLNALLASMIHQAKRIALLNLRELDDGTFAATVIVNDANVASDPILVELQEKLTSKVR